MKKVHIFDLDGTLIDSMTQFPKANLRVLEEEGITPPEDVVNIITPLGYRGTAEYFRTLGVKESVDELIGIMNDYARIEYENNVPAKTSVAETLREMKNKGYSLNVLTASPHDTLDPCLKRLGIFDLFDNVWSCNDFGTTKADPAIYHMAAERIGVSVGEVIFLDDNFNADQTAKKAGMQVYGVYDDSSKEYIEEIKGITDRYIYDFTELL